MANRRFNQFYNTFHKMPVQLDCNFTVARTNANGLGITGLVGAGIENVFMHTTQTPGVGNGSYTNPNPADGNIVVQFQDNYTYLISSYGEMTSPGNGTDQVVTSGLSVGVVYKITVLGTTTAANWLTLGVPVGTTPAVGVAFVAASTGTGSGTARVQPSLSTHSNIGHIELFGNPNTTITSSIGAITGNSSGPYAIFKCIGPKFAAFTGDTHSNTTVDNLSSLAGLQVGEVISGTGIPLGTTISAVGASSITLSAAATASATGVAMTAGPYGGLVTPADGTVIRMNFLLQNSAITNNGY